jgi:hypothetical protein
MAFVLRPYRRLPAVIPATYEHWLGEGEGIVWNLSSSGWRLSGDLLLALGDICSLTACYPLTNRSWLRLGQYDGCEAKSLELKR